MEGLHALSAFLVVFCLCQDYSLNADVYDNLWQFSRLHRQPNPRDAFSNDINACLFTSWTKGDMDGMPVLSSEVDCTDESRYSQLCYRPEGSGQALFALCYDRHNLIPVLSGHIVRPANGKGRPATFRTDRGKYAPKPQAAVQDYSAKNQQKEFPEFNVSRNYYCAKGHLTPNSDFGDDDEREETFILTNAAPQWQRFNEGNWLAVESAVRKYVLMNNTMVYVFTGTGGIAKDNTGTPYKLNKRVQAPKYYWKAICSPSIQQSLVFVGVNSVGSQSNEKTTGCNGRQQTNQLGVVYCDSLEKIRSTSEYSDFLLPPFDQHNCKTSDRGSFLDPFLHRLK